jgi:hypothetical protein
MPTRSSTETANPFPIFGLDEPAWKAMPTLLKKERLKSALKIAEGYR